MNVMESTKKQKWISEDVCSFFGFYEYEPVWLFGHWSAWEDAVKPIDTPPPLNDTLLDGSTVGNGASVPIV